MVQIRPAATDPEIMEEIGRRLRALRKARKMTLAEAGERAELGLSTVARAEKGRGPQLLTVIRLLRVYGKIGALEQFIPEPVISPMDVMRRKKGRGQRRG